MSLSETIPSPALTTDHSPKWLTVAGAFAVIGGIAAILFPPLSSVATSLFVGWILVFSALGVLVDAFAGGGATRVVGRLLLALLSAVAGLYLLLAPLRGTVTLTFVLAAYLIAAGFARAGIGFGQRGRPGTGAMIFSGLAGIVVGVLVAVHLPTSAAWALGLLVGIDLLLFGLAALATAAAVRRSAI